MYWRWQFALVIVLSATPAAFARPAHKQAFAQYFGPLLAKRLDDCRVCHLPDGSDKQTDADDDKPHNPFGARLKDMRSALRKAGKPATIETALDAILDEDSDGDGVSNRVEILTGHFPGDKDDRPTADELAKAKTVLAEFLKLKSGYPWRPFEVVKRPAIPKVKNATWVRNPIDAFIAAEHEAIGLTPRPEAPPEVLLRRVFLDLIGLPPTPAEMDAFRKDCASAKPQAAFERVVERLLADPRYGERWGRHWMDVWRYSDWAGFGPQVRDSQPHIWRWRDWIIDSLNADKGYDRMILEMLAGDEVAPDDPMALTGTGYLVRNWKLLSREKWIQDTVEHTAQAFLGITLQCAKCHDHMFDPILQKDYYQFRAIFEPHDVRTDRVPGQADVKLDGLPRVYDKDLNPTTFLFIRGDDRTPDKSQTIVPGVPEALGGRFPKVEPVSLPQNAVAPERRPFVLLEEIKNLEKELAKARESREKATDAKRPLAELAVAQAEARLEAQTKLAAAEQLERSDKKDDELFKALTQAQRRRALAEARYALLAIEHEPAPKVDAAKLAVVKRMRRETAQANLEKAEAALELPPSANYAKRVVATFPEKSSGRRLALAKWIANSANPLTARVAVNHIWLRHFGQALVPTVADFGKNGRPATHPALLDWLAAEFMHPSFSPGSQNRGGQASTLPSPPGGEGPGVRGWSMKHLHRLIVTSNAYRMASTPDAANLAIDRDNKYLWRFAPRRLEAEAVRDSIFYVAGKLDPKMGGPEIDYPLGLTVPRRSIYFRHAAEKEMEFLAIFDSANVTECYERKQSIVPQQALALLNNELTLRHARILAQALDAKVKSDATLFTTAAFEHVLSRAPTTAELAECKAFLEEQKRRLVESKTAGPTGLSPDGAQPAPDAALRARENLVHVLMNHHEFVTMR